MVKEAAEDRCEEVKVLQDAVEQLLREFKGGRENAANETLSFRVKSLEKAANEYKNTGKKVENRARTLDRLHNSMATLDKELQRIHVSNSLLLSFTGVDQQDR